MLGRIWIAALVAVAVVGITGHAQAAVCTSTTSFEWDGVGTGDWSCGAGTAFDTYRIGSGHIVSIVSNVLLADEIDARIEVLAGGTLETSADRSITIELGRSGMLCLPGSTCRLTGRYRELRSASALPRATREENVLGKDILGSRAPQSRCDPELANLVRRRPWRRADVRRGPPAPARPGAY